MPERLKFPIGSHVRTNYDWDTQTWSGLEDKKFSGRVLSYSEKDDIYKIKLNNPQIFRNKKSFLSKWLELISSPSIISVKPENKSHLFKWLKKTS
jgi:hypothetical protein